MGTEVERNQESNIRYKDYKVYHGDALVHPAMKGGGKDGLILGDDPTQGYWVNWEGVAGRGVWFLMTQALWFQLAAGWPSQKTILKLTGY